MRTNPGVQVSDVRDVYEGGQARLYELFMGQQIHVGGYASSIELAELAGVGAGQTGVELCCGTGASMRMLVRGRDVASMVGVELAAAQVERGAAALERDGLGDRIRFIVGDATATDLPSGEADFVWGEDAWAYVPDKSALVAEAARLVAPGGVVAFTDWVEGPAGLSDEEAGDLLQLLTFPSLQSIDGYHAELEGLGLDVVRAEDTGRFGPSFAFYTEMLRSQFTFDALELFDFDRDALDMVLEQMSALSALGHEGKLSQGRFVARKL